MRYASGAPGSHDEPSAEQLEAWRRRSSAPENEVPGAVPVSAVLGRGDDVVVALVGVQAYTTGVSFGIAVRLRTEPRGPLRHRVFELVGGHGHEDDPAMRLLLGVEYADGRTATNPTTRGWPPDLDQPDEEPQLMSSSGSGSGRSCDQTFWLSPLPPPGPLVLVCAWPAFGIPETRTVLDGTAVAEAGLQAEVLWPWEPDDDRPEEPPEPDVPPGGWFAYAVRRRDRNTGS